MFTDHCVDTLYLWACAWACVRAWCAVAKPWIFRRFHCIVYRKRCHYDGHRSCCVCMPSCLQTRLQMHESGCEEERGGRGL